MISVPVRSTDSASQDLTQRVALFLQQLRLTSHSRVVLDARGGVVTLLGQAPTFHQRQRILAATRQVAGVVQIIDRLEVAESEAAMV